MNLNQLQEFKINVDRWPTYVSRLRAWFAIHDVKPAEYSKYLVAVVGTEPLDLMIDLCFPEKPENTDFDSLVKLIEVHLAPKRSVIAERMIFRSYKQTESQSITEYLAHLKKLSKTCVFTTTEILKENLRDQFVFGLKSDKITQRLLTETELTFDRAVELALSLEAAVRDSQETAGAVSITSATDKVHAVDGSRYRGGAQRGRRMGPGRGRGGAPTGRGSGGQQRVGCYRCGQPHRQENCPFVNVECFVCGNRGHVAKVCRFRKRTSVHKVASEEEYEHFESSEDEGNQVYQLSDNEEDKRWIMTVVIDGKRVVMEGDTGAGMSIINRSTYLEHFSHIDLIQRKSCLKMYNGQKVLPKGEFKCSVQYNNKLVHNLKLVVIDNDSSNSLFGRKWMRAFGIQFPSALDTKESVACVVDSNFNKCVAIDQLMNKFPEVFSTSIGAFNKGTVGLELKTGAVPVWCRARPVPYALRPAVDAELERLQKEGVISPVEWSEWGTPVVPVIKKNGEVRLCGDFKTTLNPVLVDDKYPLPRIEDIFASLQGGRIFSKVDLSRAYQQLILNDEAKKYCTIVTNKGMFTYNRLPFGIKCAASKFQRIMEKLFRMPYVAVYQDDLLISSKNEKENMERLMQVFKILSESGLKVEKKKCSFFKRSVSYLGYIIDANGLKTEISKIDAVNRTPQPTNVSEVKAFLGLVNYYGKFVRNISSVLEPLYGLLKSNTKFIWSNECEKAFRSIKLLLREAPVLAHWDPTLPTYVTCDASPYGVAGVLAQRAMASGELRPVLHASRTLSPAERNYSQICREGLAIIFAVNRFHDYLYGNKFTLVTDCKPLASIFHENKAIPSMASNRLQRWAVILSAYNYQVKCIGSKHNCVADSLSRIPVIDENTEHRTESYIKFISEQAPINYKIVAKHTASDKTLQKLIHAINSNWIYCKDKVLKSFFSIKEYLNVESGCVLFGHRVVIPSSLQNEILKMIHACHQGIVKCKSLARGYVYWPGIDADIERECQGCETCMSTRPSPAAAPVHPWAWPQVPWYRVHVDFFSLENHTYFVLVDAHSKWIEAHSIGTTSAKLTIARLRRIISCFGLPRELVSDNGPPFSSFEFKTFMESCGIKHILVSPYKPSSNGAAESAVKIIKYCLKKAMIDKEDLQLGLDKFLLYYRSTPHSLTGKTPAQLIFGRNLRTHCDLVRPNVEDRVRDKQIVIHQKRNTKMRQFEIGDEVQFKQFRNNKSFWEIGIIMKRLGPVSYQVRQNDKLYKKHIDHIMSHSTNMNQKQESVVEKNINGDVSDFNIIPSNHKSIINDEIDDAETMVGVGDNNGSIATHSNILHSHRAEVEEQNEVVTPKRSRRPVQRFVVV